MDPPAQTETEQEPVEVSNEQPIEQNQHETIVEQSEATKNEENTSQDENGEPNDTDTVFVKVSELESINNEINEANEPAFVTEEPVAEAGQNEVRISQIVVSGENEIEIAEHPDTNEPKELINEQDRDLYDVIIVGAGIAGSSAAYFLHKKCPKLRVLVLEAKDRVGGRTQTIELKCNEEGGTSKWDVGGQWVTDTQTNITKLLGELEIETYKQYSEGKKILEASGKLISYNSSIPKVGLLSLLDMQLMMMKISSSAKRVSTLNPFENASFASGLDLTNLDQYLVSKSFGSSTSRSVIDPAIRVVFGCELSQLNSVYGSMYVRSGGGSIESLTLTDPGCSQEKRVKGGTQQISERLLLKSGLLNETGLIFNTALIEVRHVGEPQVAELITKNTQTGELRTFKAKRVISSLPLNQYVHVSFTPELPSYKRHVFENCHMGNLIKFVVTYKNTFWRSYGFSGEVVTDGSVLWSNEKRLRDGLKFEHEEIPTLGPIACVFDGTNSDGHPALVGFIGGRCSIEWLDVDPNIRKAEVVQSLVRFFGNEASNFIDYTEKCWAKERFSGGCPACNVSSSGVMRDYVRAVREPFLNVHFCGTETATVWQGYMDGAAESGERAANEVLYKLFKISDSTIKIDYDKTYYHQRSLIKKSQK